MLKGVFEREKWGLTFENEYHFNGSSCSIFKSNGKRTVQFLEKEFKKLGGLYDVTFYKNNKEVKKGKFDSLCVKEGRGTKF